MQNTVSVKLFLMEKLKHNIDKLRTKEKKATGTNAQTLKFSELDDKLEVDTDENHELISAPLIQNSDSVPDLHRLHEDISNKVHAEPDTKSLASINELTNRKMSRAKAMEYEVSNSAEETTGSRMKFATTQTDVIIRSPFKETDETNHFRSALYFSLYALGFNLILLLLRLPLYISGFLAGLSVSFVLVVFLKPFIRISLPSDNGREQPLNLPDVVILNSQKVDGSKLNEWVKVSINECDINEPFSLFMTWNFTEWTFYFPTRKGQTDDSKEKKLIASKTIKLSGASITLVPELPRQKYWIRDYPICVTNFITKETKTLVKDLTFKDNAEEENFKKFDQNWSFILIYFETDPSKEFWYHQFVNAVRNVQDKEPLCDYFISFINEDVPKRMDAIMTDQCKKKYQLYKHPEKFKMKYQSAKNNSEELQNFCSPHLLFINHLVSRISYDILRFNFMKEDIKQFVENKFVHANIPFFIEEIEVVDLDLGTKLPLIRNATNGFYNETGLWITLDVLFSGCVKATVRAKINLLKLKKAIDTTKLADDGISQEESKTNENNGDKSKHEFYNTGKFYTAISKVVSNPIVQKIKDLKTVNSAMEWVSSTPITVTFSITKCCGTVRVNIPNPPSDRVWYGFSEMPDLNVELTPQVGTTELNYDFLRDFMVSTMKQQFQKLLVLPNMDDIVIPFLHDWTKDYTPQASSKDFCKFFCGENF